MKKYLLLFPAALFGIVAMASLASSPTLAKGDGLYSPGHVVVFLYAEPTLHDLLKPVIFKTPMISHPVATNTRPLESRKAGYAAPFTVANGHRYSDVCRHDTRHNRQRAPLSRHQNSTASGQLIFNSS